MQHCCMRPTRVLLLGMPRMLRDLINAVLAAEPDMQVVGELTEEDASLPALTEAGADVVIVGLHGSEVPYVCRQLLDSRPSARILGLSSEGRDAYQYRNEPRLVALGEVSQSMLLDTIRQWGPERV
jgi:DNA-binding NarL/FixJ family response regulator